MIFRSGFLTGLQAMDDIDGLHLVRVKRAQSSPASVSCRFSIESLVDVLIID